MNNETLFLFQIISFKKYFYVSLCHIFLIFCGGPPSCGGPGQLPSLPPPLKSGPGSDADSSATGSGDPNGRNQPPGRQTVSNGRWPLCLCRRPSACRSVGHNSRLEISSRDLSAWQCDILRECLETVLWRCWFGGRKGIRSVKNCGEIGPTGVVVCLERGADLHIRSSWCHCHSLSLASVKSRLVLPFSYRLTRVVPDKGPLNVSAWLETVH